MLPRVVATQRPNRGLRSLLASAPVMNLECGSRRCDIPCRNGMPEQRNSSRSAIFAEGLSISQMWRRHRFRKHPEVRSLVGDAAAAETLAELVRSGLTLPWTPLA